jgi:hypothetical protein
VALVAVVAVAQLVLGVALFTEDTPAPTTTVVGPLPMRDKKFDPAGMTPLVGVASGRGADRIILVAARCVPSLWPCPPRTPPPGPKQSPPSNKASQTSSPRSTADKDTGHTGGTANTGGTSEKPASDKASATTSPPPTTITAPAYPGSVAEIPPVQLVIDDRGWVAVADSQPPDTRVLDAGGNVLQSGSTDEGRGVLLLVWAAGLVAVIGTGGWMLAAASRPRPVARARPASSDERRPRGATSSAAPWDTGTNLAADKTTITHDAPGADLVEVFRQYVPRERPRTREPQCPRCGSFDAHPVGSAADEARYQCRYCTFAWATTSGAPWPTIVINPRAGH